MALYGYQECIDLESGYLRSFQITLADKDSQTRRIKLGKIGEGSAEEGDLNCQGYTFPSQNIFRGAINKADNGCISGIRFQSRMGVTDIGKMVD